MKKLLLFLLLIPALSFGQLVKINNNAVTIESDGDIITGGYFYYTPAHTKCVFRDSAVVITGGTNVQITNASDSLFRELEAEGISWLRGDTALILQDGGYFVSYSLSGYGTNAVDWRMQVANKRGGVTTYSEQTVDFTTSGATNKDGRDPVFYMEFEAGDKVYPALTRVSGSGDFTAESGLFNILMYYAE